MSRGKTAHFNILSNTTEIIYSVWSIVQERNQYEDSVDKDGTKFWGLIEFISHDPFS